MFQSKLPINNKAIISNVELMQLINKKDLLADIFSDFDQNLTLHILYKMGEEDALSYMKTKKKKERIQTYIKSKMPATKFTRFIKSEHEEACENLLDCWVYYHFLKSQQFSKEELITFLLYTEDEESKEKSYEKYNKQSTQEIIMILSELKNRQISTRIFKEHNELIKYFISSKDLLRAYMALGHLIVDPFIPFSFNEDDKQEYFKGFENLTEEYIAETVSRIDLVIKDGFYIFQTNLDRLYDKLQSLSEYYSEASIGLSNFGAFPSINLLHKTKDAYNEFKKLRKEFVSYCHKSKNAKCKEEDKYRSFQDLFDLFQELIKDREKKSKQNEKLALDILSKAKKITINGSQDDKNLRNFLNKVEETEQTIKNNEAVAKEILQKDHPVNFLVKLLEDNDEVDKGKASKLAESLEKFCGADSANALVIYIFLGKIDLVKPYKETHPPVEEVSEEKDIEERQPEETKVENGKGKHEAKDIEPLTEEKEDENFLKESRIFPTSSNSRDISLSISKKPIETQTEALKELTSCLIFEGKLDAAFWFSIYLRELDPDLKYVAPPWLIEAAAISQNLQHNFGPLSPRLSSLIKEFNEEIFNGPTTWKQGIRFLIAGSMMRPSLLAPSTGASSLLRSVHFKGGLENTYTVCSAIADFGDRGCALNLKALNHVVDHISWETELENSVVSAKKWLSTAPQKLLIYLPATNVWRKWHKPGEPIHELLEPVCQNNNKKIAQVRELVEKYSNESELKALISETDKKLRPKVTSQKMIMGKGVHQIINHTHEAIKIARGWLALNEQRTDGSQDWLLDHTENLKRILNDKSKLAIEELELVEDNNKDSWWIKSGVALFRERISQMHKVFNERELINDEPPREVLLHRNLLKMSAVRLNDNLTPANASNELIVKELIKILSEGNGSWEKVFEHYCELMDHEKTLQIIEYLKRYEDETKLELFEEKRALSLKESIEELRMDKEKTRAKIEETVISDLLTEEEIVRFNAQVDTIDPEKVLFFPAIRTRLNNLRNELNSKKSEQVKRVKKRSKNMELSENEKIKIQKLIEKGDVVTAEEFIASKESGQPFLEPEQEHDEFANFFPAFINNIFSLMPPKNRQNASISNLVITAIDKGQSYGPVTVSRLRSPELKEASSILKIWLEAKRMQRMDSGQIRKILSWLGFEVNQCVEFEKTNTNQWFEVKTKPIKLCPIPAYGSSAAGRYTVLCVFGMPSEELVLEWVKQNKQKAISIVFYFGHMTEIQWRDFASQTRQNSPGTVLLDESIILYLITRRGAKLPHFFQCTLPFTTFNPFTPFATGNVPPEMFYGRRKEKQAIMDPHGACFIYGGRQLGKSALLRAVEREFHRPEEGHIALFMDLKIMGLGETRPIDDVWAFLAEWLIRYGVISKKLNETKNPDKIIDSILDWTTGDNNHHLILLMDEADNLLDEDAKDNFPRITKLKGLMERSNRRVKLVLAGLHNVQRFTRIPNHPLAHLGQPICIGPLLVDGEWREAKSLIEKPLKALGYRFQSPTLIIRILAHTNYQPSLIQLFCDGLVRHLLDPNRIVFDSKSSPPWLIEQKHIEDAYSSTNLRKNIKERFELTLNLDPRYRVIAYVIAYGALEDEEAHQKGFDISWITQEVNHWWPRGFEESSSVDDLRGLLEEMVGLGVLARTNKNTYYLRSPNVLRLLGSSDEIEHALLASETWEIPKKFESNVFRRIGKKRKIERSPLIGSQESDLLFNENGVRLIFGSVALGLEDVPYFLKIAQPNAPQGGFEILHSSVISLSSFEKEIEKFFKERSEGLNILVIPHGIPFSEAWVEKSLNRISRLKSKESIVRIIFLFDPNAIINWLKLPSAQLKELDEKGAQTILLKTWKEVCIQRWLDELEISPNSPDQRQEILEKTGGWPNLLYSFATSCLERHLNWEQVLKNLSQKIISNSERETFLDSVGLNKNTFIREIFKNWSSFGGPLLLEELNELIENVSLDEIKLGMKYGEYLGLSKRQDDDKWKVTPLIEKLLTKT
jgi:hypothetical protein